MEFGEVEPFSKIIVGEKTRCGLRTSGRNTFLRKLGGAGMTPSNNVAKMVEKYTNDSRNTNIGRFFASRRRKGVEGNAAWMSFVLPSLCYEIYYWTGVSLEQSAEVRQILADWLDGIFISDKANTTMKARGYWVDKIAARIDDLEKSGINDGTALEPRNGLRRPRPR